MRRLKKDVEAKPKSVSRDYKCEKCGNIFSSRRKVCKIICPKCKSNSVIFASSRNLNFEI